MKTAAVALWLSCAFLGCAQDANPETKRLQSVTWDLATHKLVWMVEKGSVVNGEFVPSTTVKYEVSPDEASMAFGGEQRSFGLEEAVALHHLLDTLSLYCVESVVWWNKHADSDSDDPATSTPISKPDVKPLKVGIVQRPRRLGPF